MLAQGHGEIEIRFRHFKTGEARWMAYKVLTLPDAAGRPMASPRSARTSPSGGGWRDGWRRPVGGEPPQDRVPGHAGARAAKPAGPDQQRRARPARRTRRCEGGARGAGDVRTSGGPAGAPGRRSPRPEPRHARQDRASQTARRAGADRRAGRRGGARAVRQPRPGADGDAADPARLSERRSRAAGAGDRQPAEQRVQVHRPGRPHRADGRRTKARRRSFACGTTASASRPNSFPTCSRCSRRRTRRWNARATGWASA